MKERFFTSAFLSNKKCVYIIENVSNQKVYVGCTKNMKRRFEEHRGNLLFFRHPNSELQKDYNNGDVFVFKPIKTNFDDTNESIRFFELMEIKELRKHGTITYNGESDEQIEKLLVKNSYKTIYRNELQRKRNDWYYEHFGKSFDEYVFNLECVLIKN